jgi:murein DD-endopeptidase MepM/ murein hydrolase activator NlpD
MNLPNNFFGNRKTKLNDCIRRVSVLLLVTIMVLTISHVSNIKHLEAKAEALHEMETRSKEIYLDGEYLGQVRSEDDFQDIIFDIKEVLQHKEGMDVKILNDIDLVDSHAEDKELTDKRKIESRIKGNIDYNVVAYAVEVDGERLGILPSKELAEQLLEDIKAPYYEMTEDSEEVVIEIAQDVNIVETQASKDELEDYDELLYFIQKGTTVEKTHVVEQGENSWTIASQYNISVSDLMAANPNRNINLIHPGDELSLVVPKPYIGVRTKEIAVYEQKISYDTEYEKVSWLYNDEYQTKRNGEYGLVEVKAEIIKENGIEVSRNIVDENTLEEPVTEILYNGTKDPPPKKGTGYFNNPLPTGYVSSRYGPRWSGFHHGIDIASSTGTPIKAADGGEVIYAGWYGDYGYLVEIDHGGGFTTRYAHCSAIYVSAGEKVYQGKTIAAVGNTGYSTGPHVHFEVRKYGSTVNPAAYIGTQYR